MIQRTQNRNSLTKNKLHGYQWEEWRRARLGIDMYTLYLETYNQEGPTIQQEDSAPILPSSLNGKKEFEKEQIHV